MLCAGKEETKYTKDGPGKPGGQSWTVDWLKFNNAYFKDVKAHSDAELLVLPTDAAVFEDAGFRYGLSQHLHSVRHMYVVTPMSLATQRRRLQVCAAGFEIHLGQYTAYQKLLISHP
jgi:hypothetical protein